ncbi:MAG: Ldh family oxidoreductase, partial [Proteobacteria bacterium]|nr:Ldh family oxidoreductase [Pseudomonadota bacterium]
IEKIYGYLIIAIQPDVFLPLEEFKRQICEVIAEIKATPTQKGIAEIRIPGERAFGERAYRTRAGIDIDRRIYDALGVFASRS